MKFSGLIIFLFFFTIASAQTEPIRGTWITNVASNALLNKQNVVQAVKNCKTAGLNHIFVVVWNNGVTMYPSKVLEKYIGIKQDKKYKGFDPIKCIVEEGHKQGIKVHAWFEFGFSYSYNDTSNSIWYKKYPHWAGRKSDGSLLQKNKFYWWSSLHPEVQAFMKELILEVVVNYKVDGIQGDDRLPAMPSEGGYDEYTKKIYNLEFGQLVPDNPKDSAFMQWKAGKLSEFGKELYTIVKQTRKTCLVTWAPSIYPWSKEEYLQDWPNWLKGGYADYIMPQLYRYNIKAYEKILKELKMQIPAKYSGKVFPGILTSLGDGYQSRRTLTDSMVTLNRKYGFKGEVFFYYETLNRLPGGLYGIGKPETVNPKNVAKATTVPVTTQQQLRDALKVFPNITITFEGTKLVAVGKVKKGDKIKIAQICAANKTAANLSAISEQ
jgi:uncharacterized lipoprotein YddW (UPF0748 family)